MPQRLHFEDINDISKHMIIGVPEGDQTIVITVKSKAPSNFYPKLYFQFYPNIETRMQQSSIEFPPNGSPGFTSYKKWDEKLNILTY